MSQKIKIFLIINGLYRGGAQKILSDLIVKGNHSRFQYHVVYLSPIKEEQVIDTYFNAIKDAGVKLTEVSGNHFLIILKLFWLMRKENPALVQTFLPLASVLGRISGFFSGIPVVSLQCNLPHVYPFLIRIADFVTLPICTAWLGATRGIEESYGKGNSELFTDVSWKAGRRHFTVYAGVDVTAIQESINRIDSQSVRKEFSISDNVPIVLMVARLVPWKGHNTLLQAMASVPYAHVLFVGWGPAEEKLRSITKLLLLEDRVHFLGQRSDVYRLLGAADIFVQTHEVNDKGHVWQGPNLAQMEACAAGVPSISSAVPHIEELIEDGVTGRLVALNDTNNLAEILNQMLDNKEYSLALSKLATERVVNFFSVASMVKAYEHIWSYVIQKSYE